MSKFWINVTTSCNLACSYCYQNNRSNSMLLDKNADKVIDVILKSEDDAHDIFFFGGEPLLNFSSLKYINSKLRGKTRAQLNYSMTTNLTILTNEMIDFICDNNINVCISIDGDETSHTLNRYDANGDINYFRITINNLKKILDRGHKKVNILKVLTLNNYQSYYDDMVFLSKFNCQIVVNLDENLDKALANQSPEEIGFSIEKYKYEMKRIFLYFINKSEEIGNFTYVYDLKERFKGLFYDDFSKVGKDNALRCCTNLDNVYINCNTNGNFSPCHYIDEKSDTILSNYVYENHDELIESIVKDKNLREFSESEKLCYITKKQISSKCGICKYRDSCLHDFYYESNNLCYYNRLRHRLSTEIQARHISSYCMKRDMLDMVFECVNEGSASINDLLK